MNKKKETYGAGGIVLNSFGQIVLVQMNDGNWSYPKGHIETTESKLDAAKREITEETGLNDLSLIKKLGTYQRPSADDENEIKNITLFLFKTRESILKPKAKDITKAVWIDISKVKSTLSFPKDKEFFEKIYSELKNLMP